MDAAAHRPVPPHRQLFYLLPTLGRHAVEVRVLPVLAPSFLPLVSVPSGDEETIFEYDQTMLLNELNQFVLMKAFKAKKNLPLI